MEFKKYLAEKKIIKEEDDVEVDDEKMIQEVIDKNWSKSAEGVTEACKLMQETSKTDNKTSDKFLKEMDDFTSGLKESYVLGLGKKR